MENTLGNTTPLVECVKHVTRSNLCIWWKGFFLVWCVVWETAYYGRSNDACHDQTTVVIFRLLIWLLYLDIDVVLVTFIKKRLKT
jgi:uncharacterized membrane protein